MSAFTDKHSNDLKLLLETHVNSIKASLPKYGEAYATRIHEELQRPFLAFLDKLDAIRSSGRYSPEGEHAERRAAARAMFEALSKLRETTVAKLDTQLAEARAAALKSKKTTDPLEAILREMRARETREAWRPLDPLDKATRIRQTDDPDLLDALDGAPIGFPIAPPELLAEARIRIAEQNDPASGELAQLKAAYSYALGAAEQTTLAAAGMSKLEAVTDPTPPTDPRKPVLVSSGQEV